MRHCHDTDERFQLRARRRRRRRRVQHQQQRTCASAVPRGTPKRRLANSANQPARAVRANATADANHLRRRDARAHSDVAVAWANRPSALARRLGRNARGADGVFRRESPRRLGEASSISPHTDVQTSPAARCGALTRCGDEIARGTSQRRVANAEAPHATRRRCSASRCRRRFGTAALGG